MNANPLSRLYPWQLTHWQALEQRKKNLPHALLLQSPQGVGELVLTTSFVASLLCPQPLADGFACGHCLSCRYVAEGNHPDLYWVVPEKFESRLVEALEPLEVQVNFAERTESENKKNLSRDIKIEQIRELIDFLSKSSHQAGRRIAVVWPAENMNVAASNALLKVLEEPGEAVLLILLCHQPDLLLPTIRSRCQRIVLNKPSESVTLEWIMNQNNALSEQDALLMVSFASNAPLKALQLSQTITPSELPKKPKTKAEASNDENLAILPIGWGKLLAQGENLAISAAISYANDFTLNTNLQMIYRWLFDLILHTEHLAPHFFSQHDHAIHQILRHANKTKLMNLERKVAKLLKVRDHPLAMALQLEAILLEYVAVFR